MTHQGLEELPFFNEAAVARVLGWEPLINAMEKAMCALSSGQVAQPLRQMVAVPGHDAFFGTMPAAGSAIAVKVVTFYHGNAGTDMPTHQAVILLFNKDNGAPVAVLDGRLITEMRTAAASAAAARAFAVTSPEVVTILGSGVQARAHARALAIVRPCGELRLWARDGASGRAAAEAVGAVFVDDAERAVRGADIVACTTAATEPILMGDWLKPGAFVAAVGWNTPDGRELDDAAMGHTVVVESREAALDQSGNVRGSGCEIFAEVGEVYLGVRQVPSDATVIYDSVGVAVMDAAAAKLAYDLMR
jgi:thiomorpholine-carboxylate dehydrogenase